MSRYIDADEALRMMRNSKQDCPLKDDKRGIWNVAHDCTISCVEAVPTADVVEVRHGTWYHGTENGAVYAKCSACGRKMNYSCYGYAYCALCGAKMDGERKRNEEDNRGSTDYM